MVISAYDLINCRLVSIIVDSKMEIKEKILKLSFCQIFFRKILSIFYIEVGPLKGSKSRQKCCRGSCADAAHELFSMRVHRDFYVL